MEQLRSVDVTWPLVRLVLLGGRDAGSSLHRLPPELLHEIARRVGRTPILRLASELVAAGMPLPAEVPIVSDPVLLAAQRGTGTRDGGSWPRRGPRGAQGIDEVMRWLHAQFLPHRKGGYRKQTVHLTNYQLGG